MAGRKTRQSNRVKSARDEPSSESESEYEVEDIVSKRIKRVILGHALI